MMASQYNVWMTQIWFSMPRIVLFEPEKTVTPTLTTTEVPTNTTGKPAETQKIPGFEVLVSLIGLVCVLLARRHNN